MSHSITQDLINKKLFRLSLRELAQLQETVKKGKLDLNEKFILFDSYLRGRDRYLITRILWIFVIVFVLWLMITTFCDYPKNLKWFIGSSIAMTFVIICTYAITYKIWRYRLHKNDDEEKPVNIRRVLDVLKLFFISEQLNVEFLADHLFKGIEKRSNVSPKYEDIINSLDKLQKDVSVILTKLNKDSLDISPDKVNQAEQPKAPQ